MSSRTATGPSLEDVNAAVRSVLSDLALAARVNGAGGGRSVSGPGDDVFAGRLLSLREAVKLPVGLREVKVAPGTVVTPLAGDHLRRLGVGIRFVSRSEAGRAGNVGEWGFAIETGSGVVEAFRRSLLDGPEDWREVGESGLDAADWVSEGRCRGALVLTEDASVGVYRACQVPGVRAATAEDAGGVMKAVRAMGVNLIVVEPAGKPIALLRQIGADFRRSGGPVAPNWIDHRGGGRTS